MIEAQISNYTEQKSILSLIGNTPVAPIVNLNPNPKVKIYAKLEGTNPGGSIKDRIALAMIEAAERTGELTKDKIILEATSGNTGIGLALVGTVKGYRVILTMSAAMSEERKSMLRALGAEVVETDPSKGTDGAILKAREMYENNPEKYWMSNQFDNIHNILAHYNGTGLEIIRQVPDVTMFVAGMGTSGTLMGVSQRLKEYNPNIQIVGVEPQPGHKIQGLKNMSEAVVPKIYQEKRLDKKVTAYNEPAYETARQLALKEGIFVGMSSGAAMWAALEEAKHMDSGTIVVLLPDRGEKYLSTSLFKP